MCAEQAVRPASPLNRPWCGGLLSGLLIWAAFPPLDAWPLAWLAPIGWIRLIRTANLVGPHPYRTLYVIGTLHWLLMTQWVRLPHWSTSFGWFALSAYLGAYIPLFIGLSRYAVHRGRLPAVVAIPLVWTGLEWVRGHLFTGFSLALLGHSQIAWTPIVQIADLGGAYGVSFLVMMVAVCMEQVIFGGKRAKCWGAVVGLAGMAAALAYGYVRLLPARSPLDERPLRVALIQGCIDATFDEKDADPLKTWREYTELTVRACRQYTDLDLIIWPESAAPTRHVMDRDWGDPAESASARSQFADDVQAEEDAITRLLAQLTATPKLVGATRVRFGGGRQLATYNSAMLIGPAGETTSIYDKMHPVMFGEYIPFGWLVPALYKLTPLSGGLTPGSEPIAMPVKDWWVSPCICFENTIPHMIRRHVRQLTDRGTEPDVLVTITNDGWFWGSSLLDLHLTCGRFRAIETRKPMLIAANTGFSAAIDGRGELLTRGPRRARDVLLAEVHRNDQTSGYLLWGDWPWGIGLGIFLVASVVACRAAEDVTHISSV